MNFSEVAPKPSCATSYVTSVTIMSLSHLLCCLSYVLDITVSTSHNRNNQAGSAGVISSYFVLSSSLFAVENFYPLLHFITADTPVRQVLPATATWLVQSSLFKEDS